MVYFQNDEIKIRDIVEEDIRSLFSWGIDSSLNEHDPRPLPQNSKQLIEECTRFSKRFDNEVMNSNIEERKYMYFMITDNKDVPIGFVNFFSIDKEKKQGEMGVIIGDKRYWRKGIASKAVNVVTEYIFNELGMDRVYIETGENNLPALKLFEKSNFNRCDEYIEADNYKFIVMEKLKNK